eukprot:1177221-Prorocentrum_minimum.AAC.2
MRPGNRSSRGMRRSRRDMSLPAEEATLAHPAYNDTPTPCFEHVTFGYERGFARSPCSLGLGR